MKHRRAHLAERVETLAAECPELAESCRAWLGSREDAVLSAQAGKALLAACETLSHPLMKEIAASADLLAAKSVRLIYLYNLETTFQCFILFEILLIFIKGCRTD